jgi:hypothetical protein
MIRRFHRAVSPRPYLTGLIATVLVLAVPLPHASANDRVQQAVRVLVTLCLGGGSVTVSRSQSTPSGGDFRLESDRGNFTVESREAIGLVDGIGNAINSLSADQANRARECMRPYISQVLAIATGSQMGEAPVLPNEKLKNISVVYYLKTADGSKVTDALKHRGISFTQLSSKLPDSFRTNAIWCGPQTPAVAIKELALTLVDNGIPIQYIERIPSNAENVLYLMSRATLKDKELRSRPLSRAQIDALTECPKTLDEHISNVTRFKTPRPTGKSDETRYVSAWLDREQLRGPSDAASRFCALRGFSDSTRFRYERVQDENLVAVLLGDNSTCQRDCSVFTSIDCD